MKNSNPFDRTGHEWNALRRRYEWVFLPHPRLKLCGYMKISISRKTHHLWTHFSVTMKDPKDKPSKWESVLLEFNQWYNGSPKPQTFQDMPPLIASGAAAGVGQGFTAIHAHAPATASILTRNEFGGALVGLGMRSLHQESDLGVSTCLAICSGAIFW